jgi:hypothetical protein
MRLRTIAVLTALLAALVSAPAAHADIGTHCGGWKSMPNGVYQNACYDRTMNYLVRARGRAYEASRAELDHLSISVTLQASADGTSWKAVKSAVCGFADGDIADEAPGNACTTGTVSADEGLLYRSRVFVVLFWSNGAITQTSPTFSGMTT